MTATHFAKALVTRGSPGLPRKFLLAALLLVAPAASAEEGNTGHIHPEAANVPGGVAVGSGAYVGSEPPLWENLGTLTYPITTANPAAQRYFDQGLRLAYAFNHPEAQRAFRWAQTLDPTCAMCFWGEALVLGPNINAPMNEPAHAAAWKALQSAKSLSRHSTAKEREMIEALSKRYLEKPKADRKALDSAYALAMGRLAKSFPTDDEIAVLYAESLMDLSPWDYWRDGGRRPKGHTAEIIQVLERVLERNPKHPGAIHYYIHMVEASSRPERAAPYAERLAGLMPGAGHLVHMPGHLYFRLGRYLDALEANRNAIAADEAYLKQSAASGLYAEMYYPHNVHFLLVSAQMAGDGTTALEAADKLAALISMDTARATPVAQPIKAAPYFAYAQFGTPERVLSLADPGADLPYVQALWRYVRGIAAVEKMALEDARTELIALTEIARKGDFKGLSAAGVPAQDIVHIAEEILAARIAQAKGELASALAGMERAALIQEKLPYMEPPYWYYPVRRSMGALRFLSGDLSGAERELSLSLRRRPNDAWALQALAEVYRKRGDEKAATEIEQRLAKARAAGSTPFKMERL